MTGGKKETLSPKMLAGFKVQILMLTVSQFDNG
jgi:hypothetical protein